MPTADEGPQEEKLQEEPRPDAFKGQKGPWEAIWTCCLKLGKCFSSPGCSFFIRNMRKLC